MAYVDLLKLAEWQEKRFFILNKHNYTCMKCNNQKLFAYSKIGAVKSIHDNENSFERILNNYPIKYYVYFNDFSEANFITHSKIDNLNRVDDLIIYYCDIPGQIPSYHKPETHKNTITLILEKYTNKIIYARDLHVHHTYYQEGNMPWEYPSESLEVYCWSCHEELHKNESIPVKNKMGNKIDNKNYCPRCLGVGYFPEYAHIQNGACFRCDGECYV